ncbi:hypothetical protein QUF80_16915 [Desulfococcaceae bacterium HSG8]|nr:hypothetical protein [Desulfococcaceae bacterium HSG8]
MARQQTGSEKWPPSAWKRLLELVLPGIGELPTEMIWTLGTALAISLEHRISYDIDIFFQDANALKLLSPNKNRKIRLLSDTWQQPGHYLKIERPEGDIDFLVTRALTKEPSFLYDPGLQSVIFLTWPFFQNWNLTGCNRHLMIMIFEMRFPELWIG